MYRGLHIQATLHHWGQLNTACLPLGLSFDCTKELQELTLQLLHLQGHKATEMHIVKNTIQEFLLAFKLEFFSSEKITTGKGSRKLKDTLGMQILLRYGPQQSELA